MFPLESLASSFPTSQQLKENDFPQDTVLAWYHQHCDLYEGSAPEGVSDEDWNLMQGRPVVCVRSEMEGHEPICAAPTAEEILKQLPEKLDRDYYLEAVLRKDYVSVGWFDWDDEYLGCSAKTERTQSLAEAAAQTFLWYRQYQRENERKPVVTTGRVAKESER
jgi:hypothetical protein